MENRSAPDTDDERTLAYRRAIDSLTNLIFLIEKHASDPVRIRKHCELAEEIIAELKSRMEDSNPNFRPN